MGKEKTTILISGTHKLVSDAEGKNWELFEFREIDGKNARTDWVSMRLYYQSLTAALIDIHRRKLRMDGGTMTLEEAVDRCREIAREVASIEITTCP